MPGLALMRARTTLRRRICVFVVLWLAHQRAASFLGWRRLHSQLVVRACRVWCIFFFNRVCGRAIVVTPIQPLLSCCE